MSQITLTQINNGDVNDAVPVMSNFNAVKNRINLGMESDNIAAGAVNGSHINLGAYIFKQSKGADVASASSISLGNDGNFFDITGTTNITSITAKTAGTVVQLQFDGILTLTDGSNLLLNGNFVTSAGATIQLVSDGTNWYELSRSPGFFPTAANALSGSVIQSLTDQETGVLTGTALIPQDDTIPQQSGPEGFEVCSQTITPSNASNLIEINGIVMVSPSGSSKVSAVIYQDSTAGALKAIGCTNITAGEIGIICINHKMTAGTTSATTFKLWVGQADAGTLTVNGISGGRYYGGVAGSYLNVKEIKA